MIDVDFKNWQEKETLTLYIDKENDRATWI